MSARVGLPFLAVICLAMALRCLLGWRESLAGEAQSLPANVRIPADQGLAVGTASCSARACHGSLVPDGDNLVRRDEYTKWLAADKHARAYLVLFEPRSEAIAERLHLKDAHTADRCLTCHQYPGEAVLIARERSSEEKFFGIGCEACHGGAKDWLEPHTQKLTASEKDAKGMRDVGDPRRLAEACVGCHVGSPPTPEFPRGRDVNHDLVAAGHPRLNFEFAAYRANLPPHWNEDKNTWTPGSLAAAWAVGQAITAKAALQLLAHRAIEAKVNAHRTPWPEFSEYDCFACHHDLQAPSWRQEPAFAHRQPGSLAWSTWYYAMPRLLAEPVYANVPDLLRSFDELDRFMRKPSPDKELVAAEAGKAIRQIDDALLKELSSVDHDARSLALAYCRNLENVKLAVSHGNWDAAAQLYLALTALEDGKHDRQVGAAIQELFKKLAFPAGKEADEQYDSPRDYQPKLLYEILKPLQP